MEITQAIAEKVLATVDAGLVSGLGVPEPGKMCLQAAVCHALGLPHGDKPLTCVGADLNRLNIRLNDRWWSSEQARAKGMRRLGLAQLGSAGVVDGKEFRRRVVDMTIRKAVAAALRSAAKVNPKHAEALEAAAVRCEQEGTREACEQARADAAAAAADAYADAADYAAAAYDDDAAARRAARDSFLTQYAEHVVQILVAMKAPGCQWLDLAPKVEPLSRRDER